MFLCCSDNKRCKIFIFLLLQWRRRSFSIRTVQLVDIHFRKSAKCWVSEKEEHFWFIALNLLKCVKNLEKKFSLDIFFSIHECAPLLTFIPIAGGKWVYCSFWILSRKFDVERKLFRCIPFSIYTARSVCNCVWLMYTFVNCYKMCLIVWKCSTVQRALNLAFVYV